MFIGDELSAAGYRLAGFAVLSPSLADCEAVLNEQLLRRPPFLLLSAEYAQALGAGSVDRMLIRFDPPVGIVRDAGGRVSAPDIARRVRRTLGIER